MASGATGLQVNIGTSLRSRSRTCSPCCRPSADAGLVKCSYGLSGCVLTINANQFATNGTFAGTGGNALTLAKTSTAITVSGATLAGGTGTWQTFWTNLASVINNGNPFQVRASSWSRARRPRRRYRSCPPGHAVGWYRRRL